jgi:hypothetical protein
MSNQILIADDCLLTEQNEEQCGTKLEDGKTSACIERFHDKLLGCHSE